MRRNHSGLERLFPNLKNTGYQITSPQTADYNCIAWAFEDSGTWWWPDANETMYWPEHLERKETLEIFVKAFEHIGYKKCSSSEVEQGYEKIAIFVDNQQIPTHAARQLPSDKWTSKIGQSFDIEHELDGVTESDYGSVGLIMKRSRKR